MSWARRFREGTEPDRAAVQRLRERSARSGELARTAAREPRPGAVARLAARLRRPRARWRLAPLALVPIVASVLFWFVSEPPDLSLRLESSSPVDLALTGAVHLRYAGTGTATGTPRAPRVRWEVGQLAVQVTPDRGVDLVVETDDGTAHVVGTAFTVTRDALGTRVAVERGHVRVSCVGEDDHVLSADETRLCLPARAAGMLARARALKDGGAQPGDVLDAADRGLALAGDDDPSEGELRALRIESLLKLGRRDEALNSARAYLALGGPRADEIRALIDALEQKP